MITKPLATIRPTVDRGKHYVASIDADGVVVKKRGPFTDAKTARETAEKLIRVFLQKRDDLRAEGYSLFLKNGNGDTEVGASTMGDIVKLRSSPEDDHEFVADACRYLENILSEKQMRLKYPNVTEDTWEKLGDDTVLLKAIELEKTRRVRDGSAKRELAQLRVIPGVDVLSGIANDATASPRHRVDAIKVLDGMAGGGAETTPAGDRYIIQINLGSDTERYNKSVKVDPNDVDPFNDPTPQQVIAAIATRKPTESGGGEPV